MTEHISVYKYYNAINPKKRHFDFFLTGFVFPSLVWFENYLISQSVDWVCVLISCLVWELSHLCQSAGFVFSSHVLRTNSSLGQSTGFVFSSHVWVENYLISWSVSWVCVLISCLGWELSHLLVSQLGLCSDLTSGLRTDSSLSERAGKSVSQSQFCPPFQISPMAERYRSHAHRA